MSDDLAEKMSREIMAHHSNAIFTAKNLRPLFSTNVNARVAIIGQAPGIKAQASGIPWDDKSGVKLMEWMGVSEKQFRNPELFSIIPMDFYYPGKGKSGDLPPRKDFAPLWHPKLLSLMPNIQLTLLIGSYAQKYYLGKSAKINLTETVRSYAQYSPKYFPIVHPSPLNFRWHGKNSWFEEQVVPELKREIARIIT